MSQVTYVGNGIANGLQYARKTAAGGDSNRDQLVITPFSTKTQDNQVLVLTTFSLNRDLPSPSEPAIVSTITSSFGTFNLVKTNYFRDVGQGNTIAIQTYVLINPAIIVSSSITIDFDRESEIVFASVVPYKNVYQTTPEASQVKSAEVTANAALNATYADPYGTSLIIGAAFAYKSVYPGSAVISGDDSQNQRFTAVNVYTRDSGGAGGSLDGSLSYQIDDVAVSDAPETYDYAIATPASSVSVCQLLELRPDDWEPVDNPVSGSYCAYVQNGEVRKCVTTVSGLDHLEGENIEIQMDGVLPTDADGELVSNLFEVSSGAITLPSAAAVVHAGLPYDGKIEMLKLSNGSALGTGQTKMRRIYSATIRLIKSLGLKVGIDEDNIASIFDADPALPLYTGDQEKIPYSTWEQNVEFVLKMEDPLPCFILMILLRSEVEEKG